MAYTYSKVTATNKVVLHAMKTSPNNVYPKAVSQDDHNVASQSINGINAGYFYLESLLQIAVNNDIPVGGKHGKGEYGSGYVNVGPAKDAAGNPTDGMMARGTLVWDSREQQFSVQVVKSAANLNVVSRNQYWAIGGISMTFQNPGVWKQRAVNEGITRPDELLNRAGLVYNNTNNIWLVVTNTPCTSEAFRSAIIEKIGSKTLVNGIFLDGSGSAQMKAGSVVLPGDGRRVPVMTALKA